MPPWPRSPPQPAPETAGGATPERWVIDSYSRTWMVCDGRLVILNKDGQFEHALSLPAPVEDIAVGREGILILYRTLKPCLEKCDLRTGAVLWSCGDRAQLKDATGQPLLVPLNRMALGVDGTVYLVEGASLAFTILDPIKGPKEPGQTFFTCHNAIPGRALLGRVGRGPCSRGRAGTRSSASSRRARSSPVAHRNPRAWCSPLRPAQQRPGVDSHIPRRGSPAGGPP